MLLMSIVHRICSSDTSSMAGILQSKPSLPLADTDIESMLHQPAGLEELTEGNMYGMTLRKECKKENPLLFQMNRKGSTSPQIPVMGRQMST